MAKHTKQSIIDLLNRNDLAVGRAMVVLYNRQTADEQSDETTKHHNGVGFSAYAAHSGTYFAKWVLDGRTLTGKYLDRARKIAIRHAGQLVEEANEKSERMAAQLRHEAQVIASEERGMATFNSVGSAAEAEALDSERQMHLMEAQYERAQSFRDNYRKELAKERAEDRCSCC